MSVYPEPLRMEHTDGFWIGRLSMTAALAAARGDKPSKEVVQEFLRSPLPSSELREMLREEMKR